MKITTIKKVFPENWNKPEGAVGYCYATYCEDTGEFYVGKRQSKNYRPTYMGSGIIPRRWVKDGLTLKNWPISWALTVDDLVQQEINFIKEALDLVDCVNIDPGTGPSMLGKKHSEETKQKMREAALKIKHGPMSQETKDKISAANIGKHGKTAEEREAVSKFHKGRKRSAETCEKIGDSKRGENHPYYGKHRDEETKRKISEAQKGRQFTPEHKEKLRQARLRYLAKIKEEDNNG